jgi:hypothetical protein
MSFQFNRRPAGAVQVPLPLFEAGEGGDPSRSDGEGEGCSCALKEALNNVEDAFGIRKDVVVPKPDHAIPVLPQPSGAVLIGACLAGVLAAVELDD